MGKGQDPISEADLHAFLDEEIGPERRLKIIEHLDHRPLDATLVETWRVQNQALRNAFTRIAREPVPLSLSLSQPLAGRGAAIPISSRRLDVVRAARQRRVAIVSAIAFLAGSIAAATGGIIVQHLPGLLRPELATPSSIGRRIASRAAAMYRTFANDRTRAVEVAGDQKSELARWFSERIGLSIIPDLSSEGLRLVGGRITPGEFGAAGFLLYEMAGGDRIGILLERGPDDGAADTVRATPNEQNTGLYGREKGTYWALIGSLGEERWKLVTQHLIVQIRAASP
ncbi:MAG: anti-sigma factor [Beijerinckiaceae bacterium]